MVDKLFGFIFGFLFNYIIFSTLIYLTNNFEFLNFINEWMIENSYLLTELENINNNLLNSIIDMEEESIN